MPLCLGGLEKMHRAVDVAVVGHGDGFLAERGDAIDQLFDVAGAVEEGIFGVQMEVGEFGHGFFNFSRRGVQRIGSLGRLKTGSIEEKAGRLKRRVGNRQQSFG